MSFQKNGSNALPSSLIVVVPARNEGTMISNVITAIQAVTGNIVVVDDRSADDTATIARTMRVNLVTTTEQSGYGSALRRGFEFAIEHGFSTIVTLDGDGAHDPSQIAELYSAHQSTDCCLSIGDRFSWTSESFIPSSKRLANRIASHVVNKLLGTSLKDVACGFRMIETNFAKKLLERPTSNGFGFAYELLAAAATDRRAIGSAPVDVRYDASEILCTNQNELLEFLEVTHREAVRCADLYRALGGLKSAVANLKGATMVLPNSVICAIPVQQVNGYIFQAQHPFLHTRSIGDTFSLA